MKIQFVTIFATEQEIRIRILFDRKEWDVSVTTCNGRVVGGFMGVRTAQLKYHDYSAKIRKENFELIRKRIEKSLAKQTIITKL